MTQNNLKSLMTLVSLHTLRSATAKFRLISIITMLLLIFTHARAQLTTLNVNGTNRSLLVYAPSNLEQNRPLVISLHGLNQDINYQKDQAKWELVADTAKFVVVYPAGVNNSWDISGTRDTDFISAIIESMVNRFGINRNRVYVTGFSMGGMMSYHTANRIADKIAAIGPVSGYLFSNATTSSRPMPIMHVHGTADDVVRYQPSGNQQGVLAMLQKWRTWNECPTVGARTDPYPANKPSSCASLDYWRACNKSDVALITLEGKGHWHSNDEACANTTVELWKFFRNFSLNTGPSVTLTSPANNAAFTAPAAIILSATATSANSTISNVRFYNGTTLLHTDDTAPYDYSWINVAPGIYSIRAVLMDNQGNTAEDETTIRVNVPQGPYNNIIHQIPGTIQAEEFDLGGNGFAYFDTTPGSETGVTFRDDEDVDIEECTDTDGGYNIGWAIAGEWLEYTVNVEKPGTYDLSLRVAANGDDRTVSVSMDGEDITGEIAVPNTGGWQAWQTITLNDITLLPGEKVMRLNIGETDFVNLNYLTFTLSEEFVQKPYKGTAHSIPGRIEAEEYDLGGEGLGYHEANTNGNEGGATLRNDEVDIEETQDIDGDYNLGYNLQGEWLEYTVNVSSNGSYDLDLRIAADGDGKVMHIEIDGVDVSDPIAVPNTAGWQTWQTVTVPDIELTEGEHVMRIIFDSDYMNLNYVEFREVLVTGNTTNASDEIEIYPNPFSNEGIRIRKSGEFTYRISDISGTMFETGKGYNDSLIGTDLVPGIYIISIENNNSVYMQKAIKK